MDRNMAVPRIQTSIAGQMAIVRLGDIKGRDDEVITIYRDIRPTRRQSEVPRWSMNTMAFMLTVTRARLVGNPAEAAELMDKAGENLGPFGRPARTRGAMAHLSKGKRSSRP